MSDKTPEDFEPKRHQPVVRAATMWDAIAYMHALIENQGAIEADLRDQQDATREARRLYHEERSLRINHAQMERRLWMFLGFLGTLLGLLGGWLWGISQ